MSSLFQVPTPCLITLIIVGLLLAHCWSRRRR